MRWKCKSWGRLPPRHIFCCVCVLSCVWFFETPGTVACQAPLSMEFSRQEHWSELLFPTPGDLPNPRTKPRFLVPPVLAGRFFPTEPPGKPILLSRATWMAQLSHFSLQCLSFSLSPPSFSSFSLPIQMVINLREEWRMASRMQSKGITTDLLKHIHVFPFSQK